MPGSPPASGPDLFPLLEGHPALERPRIFSAAAGSLFVHLAMLAAWMTMPAAPEPSIQTSSDQRFRVTPLIMPPNLVRKGRSREPSPALDVNLDALLAQQKRNQPILPVPSVQRPSSPRPAPVQAPPPRMIEAPKIDPRQPDSVEIAKNLPPGIGSAATPAVKPPTAPPVAQQPKIAFETPGGSTGPAIGGGARSSRIPVPPKSSVEEAARVAARESGRGGIVVGDTMLGTGSLGEALANPSAVPKNLSALELMNDPLGVDFKPYLIRILSTVKRNWQAVIPESARMGGRRGRVLIQFAINRDGSVPKLVIASPSGAEPLDRAAVAGISASNPFPPLPDEFQGPQIRLQFTFVYNQPVR